MRKGGREMSWIQKLYETYNNCASFVGYSSEEGDRPLLPICHISAQAQIEIVIDGEGNFKRAHIITDQKRDAITIIPCTEGSGSRSGKKPENHPLCDSLQYVASDYTRYGGVVTIGFAADPEEPYRNYAKNLADWCKSKFAHPKAEAVLRYIVKGTVVRDLVDHQKLFIGANEKFVSKGELKREKNALDIQEDAFIRWVVESPDVLETRVWKDPTLWESWINYYFTTKGKASLCIVSGREAPLTNNHPKYIRAKGDGAKLISSNDTSGFTYRGRFLSSEQACGVSLEVSQKAHNALLWLIDRQGKVFWVKGDGGRQQPGLAIVAWATSEKKIPQPTDDTADILGFDELPNDIPMTPNTAQEIALKLRNKILGYSADLARTTSVQIMAMDSASKGRLAVTYYQEQGASNYMKRINKWHEECAWIHRYRFQDKQIDGSSKKKRQFYTFVGAPAPIDIAEAVYGEKVDDRLKKATVARILPCIIEGQQIPRDLVESAVRRASNRVGIKNSDDKKFYRDEEYTWNKTLSIACSLFKKYFGEENYEMALDPERKKRDYLYGRLLAIADRIEGRALGLSKEKRSTNAARYMQQFSMHPCKTWMQIELAIGPSLSRLGGRAKYLKDLLDEVMSKFDPIEDFNMDKPLSGEFLLGYHSQREALKFIAKDEAEEQDEEQSEQEEV
jgi:CRISPR-associated protein Csd1